MRVRLPALRVCRRLRVLRRDLDQLLAETKPAPSAVTSTVTGRP
jgi:hypothetical protein